MGLTTQEMLLVEQRAANNSKSSGMAYVLWLLLGGIGVHRFYLGKPGAGLAVIAATAVSILGIGSGVGQVALATLIVMLLVDLFLIPKWAASTLNDARKSAEREVLKRREGRAR